MTNLLDVRVYPIAEPKGNTLAFASIAIDDLAAIRGIRVVNSVNGLFVAMPQSKDNNGQYHDIAFPLTSELRKEINSAVLDEYGLQDSLGPGQRGYMNTDKKDEAVGRDANEVELSVRVFPLSKPKGDTIAYASVGLDETVAINGIRVVDNDKGQFISMPQSRDREGVFHDIAFPLSGDLRRVISGAVLGEYKQQTADRKQSIGDRLAEGAEKAASYAANAPAKSVAKNAPGIGD
jgi:stage V sporulation protein G